MPTFNPPDSPSYIWQHPAWPQLTFDATVLALALDQARLEQGRLLGLLSAYATIIIDEAHERSGAFRRRMSQIIDNTTHILSRIIYNSAHAHLQPA